MLPPPILKLYEPPLDDDDDEVDISPESRTDRFAVCLFLGTLIAGLIWTLAASLVAESPPLAQ